MANESGVITHPKRQAIAQIRADYVAICGGNRCAAAILNLFEYWTETKIAANEQKKIENEIARSEGRTPPHDLGLWVYKSQSEMREELLDLWSEDVIKKALDFLITKKKFLEKRNNPKNKWDRTLQYLFVISRVQKALDSAFPKNRRSKADKSGIESGEIGDRKPEKRKSNSDKSGSNTNKTDQSKRTSKTNSKTSSPTTIEAQDDHSPDLPPDAAAGAANGGGDEKPDLSPIETLLSENGINPASWHFAANWTLEQVQVIVDRAKEPGIERPAAFIVSQLQMPSARLAAQLELDTRRNSPAPDDLAGQEATGFEFKAIPAFEPIIHGWKKETSAPDTWQQGVLPALAGQFHKATFNSWLKGSQVVAFEGNQELPTLTILAPTDTAQPWLESRMFRAVHEIAKQRFGNIALRIIAPADLETTLAAIQRNVEQPPEPPPSAAKFFSKGVGWIGREGSEQHEERVEPEPEPTEPTGQDGSRSEKPDPATLSPAKVWSKIYGGLRFNDLNNQQFETYIKPSRLIGYLENTIFVQVTDHARNEIQGNLRDKLNARIHKAAGNFWRLRFVVQSELDGLPETLIRLQEAV